MAEDEAVARRLAASGMSIILLWTSRDGTAPLLPAEARIQVLRAGDPTTYYAILPAKL